MEKQFVAQQLIGRLNEKLHEQLNVRKALILGVVLKGMPVAYSLSKMNGVIENFVPLVAQRHILLQHQVESYFPSLEWKRRFNRKLNRCTALLIVDDVVNTGFTKEKIESIVYSLDQEHAPLELTFAALVLNRENLGNPHFVNSNAFFALEVNATNVECDWGSITVPLLDLSIETALKRCEDYYRRFWQNEKRWITITY